MSRPGAIVLLLGASILLSAAAVAQPKETLSPHGASAVAATYEKLSSIPVPARRVLFGGLATPLKAQLWHYHLERYLQNHGDLSPDQEQLVADGIRLADSGIFGDDHDLSAEVSVLALIKRGEILFPHDRLREIFGILGDAPIATVNQNSEELSADGLASQHWQPTADAGIPQEDCECSTESDLCWSGYYCKSGTGCRSTGGFGCGWYWIHPCNGMCQSA